MEIFARFSFLKHRFVAVLTILSCFVGSTFAESTGSLVEVVSTGHGLTVREATKAALRSAVEQVVGMMVDATTLVENDELIEDEILSYSAGMIAASQVIGEPKKSEDGIYSVKIKATVKKGRLEEKLRGASAANVALDGADLFARMTAAQDNLQDAEAMIKDVMAKHIACVVAEPIPGKSGKSPIDLDPKTGEVFVNVHVRIDQVKYTQFANEVVEKIGAMATNRIKLNSKDYKPGGNYEYVYKTSEYPFLVMTSFRTGSAVAFEVDENILNALRSAADTGSLAVAVTLYDKLGSEIAEKHLALNNDRTDASKYISIFACPDNLAIVLPFYDSYAYTYSYGISENSGREHKNNGKYRVSLGCFTPDELKSVGNLKIKVGHMKGKQFME